MSQDPMTSYEQAEAEADERTDEARREQHYAEALLVMSDVLAVRRAIYSRRGDLPYALDIIEGIRMGNSDGFTRNHIRTLQAFDEAYGTPALLRVIATALE